MKTINDLKNALKDFARENPKHLIKSNVSVCSRPLALSDSTPLYSLDEVVNAVYSGKRCKPHSCDAVAFTKNSVVFIEFKSPFCQNGEEYNEILSGLRSKPISSLVLFSSLFVCRNDVDYLDQSLSVNYCIVTDSPDKASQDGTTFAKALSLYPDGTSCFPGFSDIKSELEQKNKSALGRIFFHRVFCLSSVQFEEFCKSFLY